MILDLCSHAVTVSSKLFVVVCGDKSTEKCFGGLARLRCECVHACTAIVASLSVRRAAASISIHLSLMDSPVVR